MPLIVPLAVPESMPISLGEEKLPAELLSCNANVLSKENVADDANEILTFDQEQISVNPIADTSMVSGALPTLML